MSVAGETGLGIDLTLKLGELREVMIRQFHTEGDHFGLPPELNTAKRGLQICVVGFVTQLGELLGEKHRLRVGEPFPSVDGQSMLTQGPNMVSYLIVKRGDRTAFPS